MPRTRSRCPRPLGLRGRAKALARRRPLRGRALAAPLSAALALGAVLGRPDVALGHIPSQGVGTQCRIVVHRSFASLTFDLSYDGYWAQAEMLEADLDRSSRVSESEAEAYLYKQWERKVRPRLAVRMDERSLPYRLKSARHEGLVGEIYGVPFSLYYEIEAPFAAGELPLGTEIEIEIEDNVVKDETPVLPIFFVPYLGHSVGDGLSVHFRIPPSAQLDAATESYVLEARPLALGLKIVEGQAPLPELPRASMRSSSGPGQDPRARDRPPPPAPTLRDRLERVMIEAIRSPERGGWPWRLGVILLVIAAGAAHALSPGHGKAMVAAYLIGTKGRIRDALVLGLVTTVTHTGSVFLFGLALFLITNAGTATSDAALARRVVVLCQLGSGAMLCLLGTTLFYRRLRGRSAGHSHAHTHALGRGQGYWHVHGPLPPDEAAGAANGAGALEAGGAVPPPGAAGGEGHGHFHAHGGGFLVGGSPSLWDLVTLGVSGGLVPCPAGLAAILLGLQTPQDLPFALFLLVFFSLGLGAVLVAIGVCLVTGKALAQGTWEATGFFASLPLIRRILPASVLASLDRAGMRLLRALPLLSALFLAALGAFFCALTWQSGATEIRAVAGLLGLS